MANGGKRDRFITEAVHQAVKAYLTTLDWFALDDAHTPITMIDGFPNDDDDVAFNTLAVSVGPSAGSAYELGSTAEEHEQVVFFDFFGESDAISRHMIGDIYEWAKMTEYLDIPDFEAVDPKPVLFQVEVMDDVDKRPVSNPTQKYQKHWWVCSFTIQDVRTHVAP